LHADIDRYLEPCLAYFDERGLDLFRHELLVVRARMELEQGRWDEAADTAAFVLRDPRTTPNITVSALTLVGLLRARRGEPDPWKPLGEALALAAPSGLPHLIVPVASARAEAAWLSGRSEVVGETTSAALELALRGRAAWFTGELLYWRWRAGIREAIPPWTAEPYALQIAGAWTRAAERWNELGCPYEAALALVDADDEAPLRQAFDELQELQARPAAAFVARRLRELGATRLPRGPRPSTRENPANLTPRELEVLELLAQGLRNAEIASRLVLSQRTVDHHVATILRKLDVPTRRHATAEATRLGLAAQDR
jgi:DNA-binding CsgD family transcriptional regulator